MKRILLSILLSLLFLVLYVIILLPITLFFGISKEVFYVFSFPLRLPSYLYYNVLHLQDNDENVVEGFVLIISAITFNTLMYAPIFYLLLTFIGKKMKKAEFSEFPPEPPSFEDGK